MTSWSELPLTEEHAAYLRNAAAITPEVAAAAGIRSASTVAELPAWAQSWGEQAVPAIVFPWRSPGGDVVEQVRPDVPAGEQKYLWPVGQCSILNTVREVTDETDTVFLVEGTKQGWAVGSYAPDNVAIYAVGGCRNWSSDGLPINDLMVVEGKKVVILLDADTKTNRAVYDAGMELARACLGESCNGEPRFVWMPGAKTTGIDDLLGKRPEDKRASFLAQQVKLAVESTGRAKQDKPAPKRPEARKENDFAMPVPGSDREVIYLDGDRLELVNRITGAMLARWNATRLFCHGDRLSQLKGQEMKPVEDGSFNDILAQTARTAYQVVRDGEVIGVKDAWPDGTTVKVVLSRADQFAELDLVARSPFARRDGSICCTNGYDEATRTMVVMDPELVGIEVPQEPTADEIAQARKLILDEWLGDFPFPDEANRANALALVITPFVRSMMYVAPLAVIDGLAPGVGKNLLVDCVLTMFLGEKPEMMGWDPNDEELRKLITSAFMTGPEVMVFDEAHKLDGPSLARALTAAYWKDRLLGGNNIKGYPNRATWISLGNNVRIEGDIFRRVYRIALRPREANPENRPTSQFRHPQLEDWTKENRAELVKAALTLVRAWFAAGKPRPTSGVTFGSFEKWAEIVGGIVETAGQSDFLGNLTAWRSESNLDAGHWAAHLAWAFDKFSSESFTCRMVRDALMGDVQSAEYPPLKSSASLDDKAAYPKALGEAYHSIRDRSFGGYRIIRPVGLDNKPLEARGGRALWQVVRDEPMHSTSADSLGNPTGAEGAEGAALLSPTRDDSYTSRAARISDDGARIGRSTAAASGPSAPSAHAYEADAFGRLLAHEQKWDNADQPSLFESLSTEEDAGPDQIAYTAVDLSSWSTDGDLELPEGVLVFDIESAGPDLWPVCPDFIRITGVQQGRTIRVHGDSAEVATLLRDARLIVGHNILGFDLLAFALHHGIDLHQLAADERVVDTMLTENVVNPPEARTKQGQIMRQLGLVALGESKGLGGKTHDLGALAKEFGGYDRIPADDARYVAYCAGDVNLTAKLAKTQERTAYARREHRIAAIAAQIRLNGFRVDVPLLRERVAAGEALRAERLQTLVDRYGLPLTKADGKASKSPHATKEGKAAIEAAFTDLGVTLGRTKSGGPAFGKEARDELIERYGDRQDVLDLLDTVGSLLGIRTVYGTVERCLIGDRVHPDITLFQASGRWSITEPGLTVMGKRGGKYVERQIFLPEPGHVIISADLSQVDARAVAAWCQDPAYLELFQPGRDSHNEIATAVWGYVDRPEGEKHPRREDAKVLGHGWNYGMGIAKLAAKIGSEDTAREFDRAMKERYPLLVQWKQDVAAQADAGDLLDNGFGRRLRTTPGYGWTQGPALMGQSAARDILMEGLLRMPRDLYPYLRAVVHDEVVMSIPEDQADDIEAQVMAALSFSWAPRDDYQPVAIEAGLAKRGRSWGACYEK